MNCSRPPFDDVKVRQAVNYAVNVPQIIESIFYGRGQESGGPVPPVLLDRQKNPTYGYNIFWLDNDYSGTGWQGVNEPPDPEFTVEGITGFTVPLTAEYNGLTCGETYHIKLAIADASDGALNSCVFLEANSFISPSVVVNPISNITGPVIIEDPSAIYEGCAAAQLEFNASGNSEYDIVLEVVTGGECEYGVDYEVTYEDGTSLDECLNNEGVLSPCITIPAGQDLLYINIQAFKVNSNFLPLRYKTIRFLFTFIY